MRGRVLIGVALAAVAAWWIVGTGDDVDGAASGGVELVERVSTPAPVAPRDAVKVSEAAPAREPERLEVARPDVAAAPSEGRVALVVDAMGAPIAGAELVALDCTNWRCMPDGVLAIAGADGVISLRDVEHDDRGLVRAVDHRPLVVDLDDGAPRWTLERGAELTLRVVDTAGAPVEAALVTWFPVGAEVWPWSLPVGEVGGQRRGEAPSVRCVEGGHVLVAVSTGPDGRARLTGLDDTAGQVLVEAEGRPRHAVADVALAVGERTDLGDVVIPDATVLRGRVTTPDGSPVEDATVKVDGDGYPAAVHATTEVDGAFTAGPLRADVPLVAVGIEDDHGRFSSFEAREHAVVAPLDVVLVPRLAMDLRLVDAATGAPVRGPFWVEPIGAPFPAPHAPDVFALTGTHADAQGRATMPGIDRIIDRLVVVADGYAREQIALVETPPGLPLTVELDPTVSFVVRVADAVTGAPVADAKLHVDRRAEDSDMLPARRVRRSSAPATGGSRSTGRVHGRPAPSPSARRPTATCPRASTWWTCPSAIPIRSRSSSNRVRRAEGRFSSPWRTSFRAGWRHSRRELRSRISTNPPIRLGSAASLTTRSTPPRTKALPRRAATSTTRRPRARAGGRAGAAPPGSARRARARRRAASRAG